MQQDLSNSLILLNGEPKTAQISTILKEGNSYRIVFKKNPKPYLYNADKVVWLTSGQWQMPSLCRVYYCERLLRDVTDIWEFRVGQRRYWRVRCANGYEVEGSDVQISITKTCLDETATKNTFAYLREVAAVNPLRKEAEGQSLLAQAYEKLDFIDEQTAAACYLNPAKHAVKQLRRGDLIYPFGCNASQKKAVEAAFEHQVSVIQGPPGTGKTQTILNIIANIVSAGKTVLVVSNNNSATANVLEKLRKYDCSFIVAPLGNKENRTSFIETQSCLPDTLSTWACSPVERELQQQTLRDTLSCLDKAYALLTSEAQLREELERVKLEWRHFCMEQGVDEHTSVGRRMKSSLLIQLWLYYQLQSEETPFQFSSIGAKLKVKLKAWWMGMIGRYWLKLRTAYGKGNQKELVITLQKLYYLNRRAEIEESLQEMATTLTHYNTEELAKRLVDTSMKSFQASLFEQFSQQEDIIFSDAKDMHVRAKQFAMRYPVVLSTTFFARYCLLGNQLYDYIIIDEASQVAIETGALALTCARNAVIVGDTLQLPNVVTSDDRTKLTAIMEQFHIAEGYDCARHSILSSVLTIIKDAPETLLREHYRCHPRIINFCNQKFYGGNLLIMTRDEGEEDVLSAYLTVEGNHAVEHYNQRELDVVQQEVLPALADYKDIGVITPYNQQVEQFRSQLPSLDTATVHKFQGREKDAIIMSVVDNKISTFADDANLLNVAVSRARRKFSLVLTSNAQEQHGNILDLLDYIRYNNCIVVESKVASIFDYLYEQYTAERMALLAQQPEISQYASENLTYQLVRTVLAADSRYAHLKVLCHVPIRQIIHDSSLMSGEELAYASNYSAHVDFLVINKLSKKPILAIETDGYAFHHEKTEQRQRDRLKDHIFSLYALPLLRLSTKGSGEKEKIIAQLDLCV